MSLDPRIDDLFEEVKKLKRAVDRMTDFITPEARYEIREILAEPGIPLRRVIRADNPDVLEEFEIDGKDLQRRLMKDKDPKVVRDTRDKVLERSDRR